MLIFQGANEHYCIRYIMFVPIAIIRAGMVFLKQYKFDTAAAASQTERRSIQFKVNRFNLTRD